MHQRRERKRSDRWYVEDGIIQNFRVAAMKEKEGEEIEKELQLDCPSEDIAEL
jgi:hypothetical protein